MPQEPTAFELRVELSGLCLYVQDPDRSKVGLLMPDGRYRGKVLDHPDGTRAVPHVGYLRFDLANLASRAARVSVRDPSETPAYEVVHQFDRESLDFGLAETREQIDTTNLALPDFDEFAPVKELAPAMFASRPPAELLMRSVLRGGTLTSILDTGVEWEMSGDLHPDGKTHVHMYGGEVHWRRMIDGPGLTLRLVSLDADRVTEIPLTPTTARGDRPAIALKIANLCATNVLEWPTFEPYGVDGPDVDFKWLYRLLQLRAGEDPIKYPPSALPHPRPLPRAKMNIFTDCHGGKITQAF